MLREILSQELRHDVAVKCGELNKQRRPFLSTIEHGKILSTLSGVNPDKMRGLIIIGVEELERDGQIGAELHIGLAGNASLLDSVLDLVQHELSAKVEAAAECNCPRCRDANEVPAVDGFEDFIRQRQAEMRSESPLDQILRRRGAGSDSLSTLTTLAALIALSRKENDNGNR